MWRVTLLPHRAFFPANPLRVDLFCLLPGGLTIHVMTYTGLAAIPTCTAPRSTEPRHPAVVYREHAMAHTQDLLPLHRFVGARLLPLLTVHEIAGSRLSAPELHTFLMHAAGPQRQAVGAVRGSPTAHPPLAS